MAEQQQLQALIEVAHNTLTLFSAGATEDVDNINKVQSALSSTQQKRQKELDSQRDVLRALARQYEIAKTASVRPASVPSEKAHREQLASLDNSKYSLAKVIAGLESDLSALEAKLARKREEVKGFESEERVPEEGIAEVLRLKIYRDLGFTPVPGDDGKYEKMLISSSARPEVHTLQCNAKRQQEAFATANRLWEYSE